MTPRPYTDSDPRTLQGARRDGFRVTSWPVSSTTAPVAASVYGHGSGEDKWTIRFDGETAHVEIGANTRTCIARAG